MTYDPRFDPEWEPFPAPDDRAEDSAYDKWAQEELDNRCDAERRTNKASAGDFNPLDDERPEVKDVA
jgi:hypothetical protein